ncbi:MAG: electron transport complex subunit RsxD [Gammaproteobacteria bacterium]
MRFETTTAPHVGGRQSVSGVMRHVLVAMIPGLVALTWFFGPGTLINIALCALTALAVEAAILTLRGRPTAPYLGDLSALLTAALLGAALPPAAPWWLPVLGTFMAMVFGKHLYGGLGYNPFNPAMVGYVVLLISFPREMTQWLAPGGADLTTPDTGTVFSLVFGGGSVDGISQATPLDIVKTETGLHHTLTEISTSSLFGSLGAAGWEWVNAGFLLGGLWLVFKRTITWHIPVSLLGAIVVWSLVFMIFDSDTYPSSLFHLFSGATMLGAFFIATDPVSAATTPRGKLIFGAGAGTIIWIIRTWGGYPDGVAFGVLLMNMAAPTIDYYTRPRVMGEPLSGERDKP